MQTILSQHKDTAYALLRIVSGFLFFCHGAQKVFGVMGGTQRELFSFIWFAGFIEVVGGLLIILGFMTGIAAFLCSGQMAVAHFYAHQFNGDGFWPIMNRGELAVLYCFLFFFIAMAGSGKWAIDRR